MNNGRSLNRHNPPCSATINGDNISQRASNQGSDGPGPQGKPQGKVYPSPAAAVADIGDGAVVLIAGYAGTGWPESLIKALADLGSKNLTVICQGQWGEQNGGSGILPLLANGQLRKLVSPMPFYPSGSAEGPIGEVESRWKAGELELEVVPQGILAERLRSGGAGLGGFFLPTGAGTRFATGSSDTQIEVRNIGGRDHLFETGLKAEFALLRARYGDTLGNLIYQGTQRNWNPAMAMAAGISIAEVDEIHEAGGLDGELVVTPGIFVKRIVKTV